MVLGPAIAACSQQVHFLGYDFVPDADRSGSDAVSGELDAGTPLDSAVMVSSNEPDSSVVSTFDDAAAETPDAGVITVVLMDPPNVLVDVLGIEPERPEQRTSNIFEQLFFGDPSTESIYVDDPTGAYVFDVFHDDTRMDAMGYAMLALPHFDRQEEFDKLWTTVDTKFRYTSGARSGYFHHTCATDFSSCSDDIDTFGVFYVVTALFIAESQWGGGNYAAAANDILVTMRSKELNGIVDGVLNLFADDGLPRRSPFEGDEPDLWSGSLMPAFFELWYVYSQDPFWHQAAERSRQLLQIVAHPATGLAAERVDRLGQPTQDPAEFREGSYGVGFHMALDQSWVGAQPGYSPSVDRLVTFFSARPGYVSDWTVEGLPLTDFPSGALIAFNGAAASIASIDEREAMMRSAWEMTVATGSIRYYDGMSQLLSLMFLGGQLKPR